MKPNMFPIKWMVVKTILNKYEATKESNVIETVKPLKKKYVLKISNINVIIAPKNPNSNIIRKIYKSSVGLKYSFLRRKSLTSPPKAPVIE